MAKSEESSPLLPIHHQGPLVKDDKNASTPPTAKCSGDPPRPAIPVGWPADGLLVGEVERAQWNSGIFSCLGRSDEFCSSDLEVCLIGSVAPCVLYGSSVERLGSAPGTFHNHCLPYTGLYMLGNTFFGWNCLAPWFSYPIRTAIRRKFNLEGSCEALTRTCGCCGSCIEDDVQREHCETACDFATHVFCHACALCQEGREVRRRLPHPAFNAQPPVVLMIPPSGQTMGRAT